MTRDNIPNRSNIGRQLHQHKIILFTIAAIAVAATIGVATMTTAASTTVQADAQNSDLSQIVNTVKPIYPQVTVMKNKILTADGVALTQLGRSTTSETIERVDGVSRSVFNEGQAELALYHVVDANGQNVIVATITNTGTSKFYLTGLTIEGGSSDGIFPLVAYAASSAYSPQVFPGIPKPPVTEPLAVNPGESVSAIFSGKWNIENTSKPIGTFNAGAVYTYEIVENMDEKPGIYNWGISVLDTKLP